jgi:hypothetical protein
MRGIPDRQKGNTMKTIGFTRFIYCYREKNTLKAVYVGSTWDVEDRDQEHQNIPMIPFDRRMTAKGGRENFVIETLESVTASTLTEAWKAAVPRENFWMDKLLTWHEYGGWNFNRACVNYDTEEQHQAWLAANVAANRRRANDPEWRGKQALGARKKAADPVHQKKRMAAWEKWKDSPTTQKAMVHRGHTLGLTAKNNRTGIFSFTLEQRRELGLKSGIENAKKPGYMANIGIIANCQRWNIDHRKPCTCGHHLGPDVRRSKTRRRLYPVYIGTRARPCSLPSTPICKLPELAGILKQWQGWIGEEKRRGKRRLSATESVNSPTNVTVEILA